jgi:hypothetical protein
MRTEVKWVKPEWAAVILASRNGKNRNLYEGRAIRFANDIRNGKWLLTHQGIAFDEDGKLIDGQHRLRAIVLANQAVQMMVTTGVKTAGKVNAFDVMDSGVSRTFAQRLQLEGYHNTNRLAAGAAIIGMIITLGHRLQFTGPEMKGILDHWSEDLLTMVNLPCPTRRDMKAPMYGPLAFYRKVNPDLIDKFAERYFSKIGLEKGDPEVAVQSWFANHPRVLSQSFRWQATRMVISAIQYKSEDRKVAKLQGSDDAMYWILEQQDEQVITKFRRELMPRERDDQ